MKMKFTPMKARMRATFAAGATEEPRVGEIDAENEILRGVQITLEGEAKGHGVWLDREFCEAVAEQGNAAGDVGVKVRFGHPAMCSDALGTYLGRAKNFAVAEVRRKDGSAACGVVADLHVAAESHSSPKGDLGKWVMEAAANSPDTFGQSIVFTYGDWKVVDADGAPHLYSAECECEDKSARKTEEAWRAQSADGRVYAVLGKLLGTDFTDSPAATDGVFSADGLAAEAEEMLAAHPEIADAVAGRPEKVAEFLARLGVLDEIESKRVKNLQAEKDREIAALQKRLGELADQSAEVERLREESAAFARGSLDKAEALAAANAEREQLKADLEQAAQALAECRKQFARLQTKHASLVGGALNAVDPMPTMADGLAKCKTPKERSAFLASGKFKR